MRLLWLSVIALIAGAAAGFVGGAFRWVLFHADTLRATISEWAHATPGGFVVPVLLTALAAAAAAAIVRLSPRSSGSGIQDVEAVVRGEAEPPPLGVLPARFIGGALAIGGGLVLGREGPTVHMAATIGASAGRATRRSSDDIRVLQTALSGAGLAVAFNAPIGGALFVFEEVTKRIQLRTVVATLASVGAAVACARLITGDRPDFTVVEPASIPLFALPLVLIFGVLIGAVGSAYSFLVIGFLDIARRLRQIPATVRAACIGAIVGGALFLDPLTVGGGDALTQAILTGHAIALPVLVMYIVIRFIAGPLSYAAGTPGGLFAPLLALGALFGLVFSRLVDILVPSFAASLGPNGSRDFAITMAVVGMSALFAAVVRAPLTGIALIIEMTAITSASIPMILAAVAAVIMATALRSQPVYESLRHLMIDGKP
ncbi:chloride channel protein [Microbacterium endophyticum]|nr:chloride channel protein [Microbacterium endophyticum]